jgi:chromosome segregation ATPase
MRSRWIKGGVIRLERLEIRGGDPCGICEAAQGYLLQFSNRLTLKQYRHINMTTDLDQRVTQLEADMEATQNILRQLAESQMRTEQSMNRLSERVDSFVYEVQRVLGNQGDRLSRIEAAVETLVATAQRHDRNAEADRAESRAFRQEMQSMTSRLDALVHYLMRQS